MMMHVNDKQSCTLDREPNLVLAIDAWQSWLAQNRRISARTLRAYKHDLNAFLAYFKSLQKHPLGLQNLQTLTPEDFKAYCEFCLSQGQASSSVARALCTLRNFLRFLMDEGFIANIELARIPAPRVSKRSSKTLSLQQIRKALQTVVDLSDEPWLAKRDLALFGLLYGAGLRLGDALSLNRGEVLDNGMVVISGPKRKVRQVSLPVWVANAIEDYLAVCPFATNQQQPLFLGIRGKRLNPGVVQRQMRRLRGILNLSSEVTPHTLRQSFALHRYAEGDDIHTIRDLLGHAYTSTTRLCLKAPKG